MSTKRANSTGRLWRWGLFLAFLALAYGWTKVLPPGDHVFLAPVLSVATLATAFAFGAGRHARRERKAIERARKGLLPRNGEWGVAIGPIVPLVEEVPEAPFSGRKAVAYIYRIYREERRGRSAKFDVAAYSGRAVALSEVRTTLGPVRVLGMPLLEVDKEVLTGWEALARARVFLSRTTFQDKEHEIGQGGTEVVLSSGAFDPGATGRREDFRYSEFSKVSDLTDWRLEESVVPPGQEVSVFGWYSESLGALTCSPEGSAGTDADVGLSLRPGGLEAAAGAQRRHSGCAKFLGLLALAFQVGAIAWFLWREAWQERRDLPNLTFVEAAKRGKPRLVKTLVERKVDLFARDESGRTAAHLAANAETLEAVLRAAALAEVRDHSGNTPLMWHSRANEPALVRVLAERGAKLDEEDSRGFTAIQLTQSEKVRKILLEGGARDPDAEIARGEALPANGGAPWKVILAELEATQREDVEAVNSLWSRSAGPPKDLVDLHVRNWWPATAEFLSGHVLGDKARVEGEGRSGSKGPYRIVFYLVREEGAWKILDARIRS